MAEETQAAPNQVEQLRTRRGRRKLDDVAAGAAKDAARTKGTATRKRVEAKTQTALLTEQEKQAQIIARKKAADRKRRKENRAEQWSTFKQWLGAVTRAVMVVGPILAPMAVAWTGQIGFAKKVLEWSFAGGVLYAGAYELSIVFCAWMYHQARKAGDTGLYYRGLTWFFAASNAVQQWWHWADDWKATPRAVIFASMTAVGILMWEAYAKLIHRQKLRADGKLPEARPRIGMVRWMRYPRISFTAWSGSIRHNFTDFSEMWIWAETERDLRRVEKDKNADLRRKLKIAQARIADLEDLAQPKTIKGEIERSTPEVAPVNPVPKQLEAGSKPDLDNDDFKPTQAEEQAVREMVEANIKLNRENVMNYMRDDDNRERLGQPNGIATKRASLLAAWGRENNDGLRVVNG